MMRIIPAQHASLSFALLFNFLFSSPFPIALPDAIPFYDDSYPKDLIIAFTLKSIRRPGENRGNAEPIADDGCKEHAVKRIENASEELIETPVKNSEKEKCEKIEESEHKVSRDIRSSEKMPVKFTKENHIIAEESNKKLTGKKGNATFVDNKKYVISCEDLKDVFQRFGAVKVSWRSLSLVLHV